MFNPTMLEDLLNAMMRHKDGWPFDRPVRQLQPLINDDILEIK